MVACVFFLPPSRFFFVTGGAPRVLVVSLPPSPPGRLQSTPVGTNPAPSSAADVTRERVEQDARARGLAEGEARMAEALRKGAASADTAETEAAGAALAAEAARKAATEAEAEAARKAAVEAEAARVS